MKEESLTQDQREALLLIARQTIGNTIGKKSGNMPTENGVSEPFNMKAGAFVSIHKKGNLRGCIGTFDTTHPVENQIREMAAAAATRDPRFSPVEENEFDDIDIEISVLTPAKTISSIEEIVVGEHGIIISKGYRRGVLLPQVATEYGWDKKTFLEHTCRKAGLPNHAWKDEETTIQIFRAEVFGEKE